MIYCFVSLMLGAFTGLSLQQAAGQSFKARQMNYPRVRRAMAEKDAALRALFRARRLAYPPARIFIRVFKRERQLELWAGGESGALTLVKSYAFCATSGRLGPKRREGDGQIPEGFYHIDRFNPLSNFHLSLGVNYPNRADRLRSGGDRPGGDIFIHGGCATVGCVPITDEGIRELYLVAVEARAAGQARIPVHIFPAKLTAQGMRQLNEEYAGQGELLAFWQSLKPGFDYFEMHRRPPAVTTDRRGHYRIGD